MELEDNRHGIDFLVLNFNIYFKRNYWKKEVLSYSKLRCSRHKEIACTVQMDIKMI